MHASAPVIRATSEARCTCIAGVEITICFGSGTALPLSWYHRRLVIGSRINLSRGHGRYIDGITRHETDIVLEVL